MSSKPIEPRSISSQLVLLFTFAALLLLSSGLGVFYWLVVRHAFEEDNAVLADKALALKAALRAFEGPKLIENEATARHSGEHSNYWIRLLKENGQAMAETPDMSRVLPTTVFPPAARSTSLVPTNYRTSGKLFSLVAVNEQSAGQPYTIQIAQDRSADDQFMKNFGALLALVLACSVIASVAIGVTVARRGLQPLAQMTAALTRITPTHLDERIEPSRWPRELQPLANAFDEMLKRLEDSFTRLSQFSGDLAHELRTPLGNILGSAQVALTRERTSAEYREVLETTAAECERLSGIVENLLFLARADAARERIEHRMFDAREAAEKVVAYYRPVAEDRQVAIECAGEGEIYGDSLLFSRAISNLIENALHFTPDGGRIDVAIQTRNGCTEVSVKDTGRGMEPEHLPRVFDRFYRADASRSSSGTGLGLALVKSIVDLHGGSVKVESAPDRGTTLCLIFPNKADSGSKL
jgi:two-component system, OmpR family, heavy metal sensor histidine kinase CusS